MSTENVTPEDGKQGGKIEFVQFHQPALKDDTYTITVTQFIQTNEAGRKKIDPASYPATRRFAVAGERFTLRPEDIAAVFPPEESLGDHSNVLPHVILNRSTLPWERVADPAREDVPWLALLLFDEEERPDPKVITLGELQGASDAKFPTFTLETGQQADDRVTVIDVKQSVLQAITPSVDELALLAHVRLRKDSAGNVTGDELAVIICNRLPAKGAASTAHLVSLERRYEGAAFDYQGAQGDQRVRLVSLKSWRFTCVPDHPSFKDLLLGLDRTTTAPRLPSDKPDAAKKYLAAGGVPVPHFMRGGDTTVSWYHGPLAPDSETTASALPARSSDELVRYDTKTGLFDISYAAAWELGRLLALQSKQLSVSLYNWKRANARQQLQAEQQLLFPHLPPQGQAATAPAALLIPADITKWFDDLKLLKGVPFNYLVPDERMLPSESVRFFQLDRFWVGCLLDGAFSIGRVTDADHAQDQGRSGGLSSGGYEKVSGVMLRSSVVAGWPSLLVDGYDEPDPAKGGTQLKQLRFERLSSSILICLYKGDVGRVEIHQQPEALHFGLDAPDAHHADYYKDLRGTDGQKGSKVLSPLPWRQPRERRVLDMKALADAIQAAANISPFTSAQFALQMIEGVEKVIFQRAPAPAQ